MTLPFGWNFLQRKQPPVAKKISTDKKITINRMTLVDLVASHLHATKMVPDTWDISNIQFSELFGASTQEYTTLNIQYSEGKKSGKKLRERD